MTQTNYLLVTKTASRMACEIDERIETEWHSGDEHDRLKWRHERLSDFIDYLRLKQRFELNTDE